MRIFPAFVVKYRDYSSTSEPSLTQKQIKTLPLYLMAWRSNSSRNTWRLKTQIKLTMNLRWMTYMMRTSVFVWLKWCARETKSGGYPTFHQPLLSLFECLQIGLNRKGSWMCSAQAEQHRQISQRAMMTIEWFESVHSTYCQPKKSWEKKSGIVFLDVFSPPEFRSGKY